MSLAGRYKEVADRLSSITPGAGLVGWLIDWTGLADLLGDWPTHHPDLDSGFGYRTFFERIGWPAGTGDRIIERGEIVTNTSTGQPVARWSYADQEMFPFLGYTREGACVFLDPTKTGDHEAHQLGLIESDRAPSKYECDLVELETQKNDTAIPGVNIYEAYGPRLVSRLSRASGAVAKIAGIATVGLTVLSIVRRSR